MILTCRQVIDFLDDYLDGGQPEAVRAEFDQHLERCPLCRDYLRTYADTVRLVKGLCDDGPDPAPLGVPDELKRAILAARAREKE